MTDRSAAPIAREHLFGATVWTYGGGAARVRAWDRKRQFSKLAGV